jgi:hypothetical protein
MIRIKVHSPSGTNIYESLKNSNLTIKDLLEDIENKVNLQNEPFHLIYNTNILYWYDRIKLYEIFRSKEFVILTIIISKEMPDTFNNLEHLINYINYMNTTKHEHFDKLIKEYYKFLHTYENTELKIINIEFISYYFQYNEELPRDTCINTLNNKQIMMNYIKNEGYLLAIASKNLQNDEEIVILAVKNDGSSLEYASKRLQNNREIGLAAVKNDGDALHYVSEKLKDDSEIVINAVQNNGYILNSASKRLKNDKKIVMIAVTQNGYALNYTSEDLKDDEDIVIIAVQNKGCALMYASKRLQNNKNIVISAIQKDIYALRYASEELQNDEEIKKIINNIIQKK